MAIRSGISTQLGIAQETTWGTYVAPDHWYEFANEGLKQTIDRLESKGLRSNNRVLRTDRWAAGKVAPAGPIEFEVLNKSFGLLFKHMLGAAAIVADGTGWKQTFTFGDPYGLGLSVQVGRTDVSGTVQPYTYTGCKIDQWELSNSVDNILNLKATLEAQNEATATALASASYPATAELFYFTQGSITLAGSAFDVTQWSVQDTIGHKKDRYFISATNPTLRREPIINAFSQPQGSLTAEFTDLTAYNRFINGTVATVVLTYATTTTYDTGKTFRCIITLQSCRFDGETPNVSSADVNMISLPFKVLYNGVDSPIKVEYFSSDTAP